MNVEAKIKIAAAKERQTTLTAKPERNCIVLTTSLLKSFDIKLPALQLRCYRLEGASKAVNCASR